MLWWSLVGLVGLGLLVAAAYVAFGVAAALGVAGVALVLLGLDGRHPVEQGRGYREDVG